MSTRILAISAVAVGDAAVLMGLAPDWARLATGLSAPGRWVARSGIDAVLGDLSAAALWALAAWLLAGLAAAWATLLPGAAGRVAAQVGRRMLPRAVRRVLAGAAGLGVLLAPVAAGAGTVSTSSGTVPANQTAITARLADSPPLGHPASTPGPRWPQTPRRPQAPHSQPRPDNLPATRPPAAANTADEVTVRPGDSLWLIAQRRLGDRATSDEVAAQWPQWYAANREVVGADPGLIEPGQVLHVPTSPGHRPVHRGAPG